MSEKKESKDISEIMIERVSPKVLKFFVDELRKFRPTVHFKGFIYYKICSDTCVLLREFRSKVQKIIDSMNKGDVSDWFEKVGPLLDKEEKQESIIIAFAAICLEACIWDYAACQTSKRYTENHLEKLDFVSKWVIIPELLCGSDITKAKTNSTCLLDRLRKLATKRNALVHSKSKPLPENYKEAIKVITTKERIIAAEDAFGLIKLLLIELEKVDKSNWWFFKSAEYKEVINKS